MHIPDPEPAASDDPFRPLSPAIYPTAVFTFADTAALIDFVEAKSPDRFEYARYGNPTQRALERHLRDLEGAEDAVVMGSGMAADTMSLLGLLGAGDHMIFTSDSYLKTRLFVEKTLPSFGIRSTIVEPDIQAVEQAIEPTTRLVLTEMPTNPLYRVVDLASLSALCHAHGLLCLVDSTLASPINLNPIAHGADLVIHSMTKYFSGGNDLLAGGVAGRRDLVAKVRFRTGELGAILPALQCYQLLRNAQTMHLRVHAQNSAALQIATHIEKHSRVRHVHYPLLASATDAAMARKYLRGGGTLLTIELDGGFEQMRRFCDACRIFRIGPSFAGPESLLDPIVIMSHWDVAPDERRRMGITDSMVRLAVGLEPVADLIDDIEQAIEKAFA